MIDMTGQQFSFLTVLGHVGSNARREAVWRCRCVCGKEKILPGSFLRTGHSKSCGCKRGRLQPVKTTEEKFRTKYVVDVRSGCWVWKSSTNDNGYGHMQVREGRGPKKTRLAHRIAYEIHKGSVPDGLTLDHLCRNRACVNPDHLDPVTIRENSLRGEGITAKNAKKTHCLNGHPLSGKNMRYDPLGKRVCKTCQAERLRKYRRREKVNRQ